MPKDSRGEVVLDLEQLTAAYRANPVSLPGLDPLIQEIETLLPEIRALNIQRGVQQAAVQQTTKEMNERVSRAKKAASRLRMGAKALYGTGAEKVVEFGIQPLRKAVRAPKVVEVEVPVIKEAADPTKSTD